MRSAEEQRFEAHDAYSSAIMLALLVLCGQGMLVITMSGHPQGFPPVGRLALITASAVALTYLFVTWKHPQEQAARLVCLLLLVPFLVIVPWAAVGWGHLGRPFEAFGTPLIAMISAGLVVPRSFRLGIATVLAYLAEALGIYVYYVAIGTPANLLPGNQPAFSIIFALVGVVVVVMRKRRRELVLRHLQVEAEAMTLTQVSSAFRLMIDEMAQPLALLPQSFDRLAGGDKPVLERAYRAIERLATVRAQLTEIITPPAPCVSPAAGPHELSESERKFYARDAFASARAMAWVSMVGGLLASWAAWRQSYQLLALLFAAQGLVGIVITWFLRRIKRYPSEAGGIALYLVQVLPFLAIMTYAQPLWARGGHAFEPLGATKGALVLLALAAPRHLRLTIGLQMLVLIQGIAVYYANHFDLLRGRSPMSEPWTTAIFFLVALAILLMREQRRVSSLRRLRAEKEAAALMRQTQLSIGLLDQVSSPLQALQLEVGILRHRGAAIIEVEALDQAFKRLRAACEHAPHVDPRASGYVPVSFDGADELSGPFRKVDP